MLLLPSFDLLNYMFEVSNQVPSGLIWKNPLSKKLKQGDMAGTKHKDGYWQVGIKINNKDKLFRAHRIIYVLSTKENIDNFFIDHIDGNRENNNIVNLRCATNQENSCNQKKQRKYTSVYKGVSWCKKTNKWRAQIGINYQKIYLGTFETEQEAAVAYNLAAKKHHTSFALLNNV